MPEAAQRGQVKKARMWPAAIWLPLAAVATLVVYKDLPHTPFFLDDYLHLHLISKFKQPFEPFYTDIFMGAFFRPAITIFWTLDHAWHGLNASGYYVSNIGYLLLSLAALYAVMHNLTGSHVLSGLTTLLFTLSPVTGVGVEWLSNRFDLIGTLFFLVSTLLFLRYARFRRAADWGLSLFFAIVAFFCKEITIVLPVTLPLCAAFMFLYRAPQRFDAELVRRLFSFTTPYFTAAAAFIIWRYLVINSFGGYVGETKEPLTLVYFLFLWRSLGEYFWLARSFFIVAPLALVSILLLAKPNFYGRNKLFLFGLAFAVITASPLAMILKFRAVMSYMTPRFFFLPNIGALIALAALYDPRGGRARRVVAAVLIAAVAVFMGLNNYILVHKWSRDKTRMAAKMDAMVAAFEVGLPQQAASPSAIVYSCLPGLDVALDSAVKLRHPDFESRFFFLHCQGPTQTVAAKSLYLQNRRLLNFPASFARNPCEYDDLIYGVVDTEPKAVLDQLRAGVPEMVMDLDREGNIILLDRAQLAKMIKTRFGIDIDETPPEAARHG
jgi:hypothetical protein